MPRAERGLLGVKKDPSKQILFSFGRGAEEWPSDDSDDSDYNPGGSDEERPHNSKQKKCKKKSGETSGNKKENEEVLHDAKNSKTRERKSAVKIDPSCTQDLWGERIPPEVLLHIFQKSVLLVGALPFLCRAARVCQLWREISKHPSLWECLDLSYGWIKSKDSTLKWLSENRLTRLKSLSVSSWKNLTHSWLEPVIQKCPHLENINLSYCPKVTAEVTKMLADSCPNLSCLDLSFVSPKAVTADSLTYLIQKHGPKLTELKLSGNKLNCFSKVLKALWENCPNLKLLEVCNATFSVNYVTLNVEKLQHGCPNLQTLSFNNSKFLPSQATTKEQDESPGFPNLEELSVATDTKGVNFGIGVYDQFLHRLLKSSHKLKLLDLRGNRTVTNEGIVSLPVNDLQHLFLSQCSMAKNDRVIDILEKWQHSLVELDLSGNVFSGILMENAMKKLSKDPSSSRLEILNLSGTSITSTSLKLLLEGCPKLRSMNLTSCRCLPRGMKREYAGHLLEQLRRDIDDKIQKELEEKQLATTG